MVERIVVVVDVVQVETLDWSYQALGWMSKQQDHGRGLHRRKPKRTSPSSERWLRGFLAAVATPAVPATSRVSLLPLPPALHETVRYHCEWWLRGMPGRLQLLFSHHVPQNGGLTVLGA